MATFRGRPEAGGRRGFTLVELLVTTAVAGLLIAFLYQFFLTQRRTYTLQEDVADAQQNGRVALEELTRSLLSLGSGTDLEHGQVRLLVAQPYQVVFNADLDPDEMGLPPGTAVPGAGAGDPYPVIPAGTYTSSWRAETYRYTLDRTNDGRVTTADWKQGSHYSLFREKNGRNNEEVASLVANPSAGQALFVYWGDFDGDGTMEVLDRVNAATSARVAAGEPLDAVIRRIDVNLIAETADPVTGGAYRQVRLSASVSPENLWDCPLVTALDAPAPIELPDASNNLVTPLRFRVTRGGVPEQGRAVAFEGRGPGGNALTVTDAPGLGGASRCTTDADGIVTAYLHWPADCAALSVDTYTVRAFTQEPPTLATPFGTCPSHEARVSIHLIPGPRVKVRFDGIFDVQSCGGRGVSPTIGYTFLDTCDKPVPSFSGDAANLRIDPALAFGTLSPSTRLDRASGTLTYTSPGGDYSRFAVPRDPAVPSWYLARLLATDPADPTHVMGETTIRVRQVPATLTLTATPNIPRTPFADCPSPALPVTDSFTVHDACGNAIPSLSGAGAWVNARLTAQPLAGWPTPAQGTIASPGNRAAFAANDVAITRNDGTDGEFAVQYRAPTCTMGGFTVRPTLSLTPSWAAASAQTLPLTLGPCGSCSVQVFNAAGTAVTHLDRECDGRSDLVVTQCVPAGTTAEVVIARVAGSGLLSLARNGASDRTTATFGAGRAGQVARLPLFIGTAQSGDTFRIAAFIPNQAAVQVGNGVLCQSELLTVDTTCSEILISAVADNPQAVPAHLPPEATPLCGAEGTAVYFRVKDCDQNTRDNAWDDIKNTAGTTRGLQVEVVDSNGAVLDRESPNLLEVDVHGTHVVDSPYFQGTLPITLEASDGPFSGRLQAPADRITTLRARYVDPDDATDDLCVAEALVVPPLPLCLSQPVLLGGDWSGLLGVHWGDAVVGGNLALPDPPGLIAKDPAAPLLAAPYGPAPSDRFFDAYVGGTISVGATPLPPARRPDQPFLPGGAGEAIAQDKGNYLDAVADVDALFARLDYEALKIRAVARRAYWQPEAGGTLFNPATLQRGSFEDVTRLGAPGALQPGAFVFVDAPAALQSGAALDRAALQDLPEYEVAGPWHSEGFLYVAGSVVFRSAAGAQGVALLAPGTLDARYDENLGNLTRPDLPIDFAAPVVPAAAGTVDVNLSGALYCDGQVTLPDGFRVYGALAAERGGQAQGSAEVWYDPRWREARLELCSRCCSLAVAPAAPRVSLASTVQLAVSGAQGAVVWESLAPQVASVNQAGLVVPAAVGTVTVRAVDGGGCVAEADVEVF